MTRPRRLAGLLAFALLVVPAFAVAQSQATTGVIEGTVSDPSGAPIAGATVIVKNTATNFEQHARDRRRRPLPGAAAAARSLQGDRLAARASRRSCARASC